MQFFPQNNLSKKLTTGGTGRLTGIFNNLKTDLLPTILFGLLPIKLIKSLISGNSLQFSIFNFQLCFYI